MSHPIVTRCADPEAVAPRVAEVMAAAIDGARTIHGAAHVALSGGSLARAYELVGPALPDWRDVHLWYGDERCVALDDEESNHRARDRAPRRARRDLAPGARPSSAATRRPRPTRRRSPASPSTSRSTAWGPTATPRRSSPASRRSTLTARASAVHGAPKPPPDRVTLTLAKLNASHRIVLAVAGADKAPMLARVIAGADPEVPASLLDRERLEIVADVAALDG